MIDNQKITDGKIEVNAITHKYLESIGAEFVIDEEGNIGLEGDNLPETEEELNVKFFEFVRKELETKTTAEVFKLVDSTVEIQIRPATIMITTPPVLDIEQPAPAEPEGFFASYYNWIFGAKKEEEVDVAQRIDITPPTPRM